MSGTQKRQDLADKVAAGLAGWLQMQDARALAGLPGEDSARFTIASIVHATGRYTVASSQRPTNWPSSSKLRVDLALRGINRGAQGWYGAIEVKWPGASFDVHQERLAIIQDLVRLLSVSVANLNASLFVLGGRADALQALFDKAHKKQAREQQRLAFDALLPRAAARTGSITGPQLTAMFPKAEKRVPPSLRPVVHTPLRTRLLATHDATCGARTVGSVYVWQVQHTAGPRPVAAAPGAAAGGP